MGAQPVDAGRRVVERLARVIGGPARLAGREAQRQEAVVGAEQQRQLARPVRRPGIGRLHEAGHAGGCQGAAALGHRLGVGAQLGRQRQHSDQGGLGRSHCEHDRALAPCARLVELAHPARQLASKQLAQPGAVFGRGVRTAGVGEREVELARRLHGVNLWVAKVPR